MMAGHPIQPMSLYLGNEKQVADLKEAKIRFQKSAMISTGRVSGSLGRFFMMDSEQQTPAPEMQL